ncbi:trans-aconitate methyltransferase [Pedobacter sp. HMWF019]|uniref:methyltransferase domain-containing protein n=1 Tax=Pedobacter sp. HMWF019 TaxID=2056856 RepID=UPI000D37BA90|nr:methyltransferase domain-containing protein [Pedobacter sp. HMWF019]PTS99584.1 trans-aconitate methyltransferase [Pedobacter sp. HMWF019]
MAWNPNIYNKFKTERFAPFYDLVALIDTKPDLKVIDLGCGTGELTRKLADQLPNSQVLGIDSSSEMLSQAVAFSNDQVTFEQRGIEEQVKLNEKYDLVFSNAAIQWSDTHKELLPEIIGMLRPGGQLAIQIPDQTGNVLNQILDELVQEETYKRALNNWRRVSPVLDIDEYAQILFENGSKNMTIYKKIYPLIVSNKEELYNWISGTALIPYLERLDGEIKESFIQEFKARIDKRFTKVSVIYPFKRILMEARF